MAMNTGRQMAPQQQPNSSPLAVLPRQQAPIARSPEAAAMALERVVTMGDLAQLHPEERVAYYLDTCQSLGLNPRSRPFDWLLLDGKVVLYPNKACADQLRALHRIRIECDMPTASPDGSMLRCTAKGIMPDGRYDTASKYVPLIGHRRDGGTYRLAGKELANAYMKAETGAKRRVTFSLIGMAAPPQDLDDVQYREVVVDGRGNILDHPTPEQRALAADPKMAQVIGEPTFEDLAGISTVYDGSPDQQPDRASWEKPRREGPSPSFRADKAKWLRAWAAAVKGTYLEDDDARHGYVAMYTSTWPEGARTNSLSRLLSIITDVQASQFIEHTKSFLAERAAAEALDPDGELDGIDGLTPQEADDVAAAQLGEHAYGDFSDEDLDARFESATTRVMGRPRAEQYPVARTALIAELRQLVERAQAAGASLDLPSDAEIADMETGAISAMVTQLQTVIATVGATD